MFLENQGFEKRWFKNTIHVFIASTFRLPKDETGITGFILDTKLESGKPFTRPPQYCYLCECTPDRSRLKTILIALCHIHVNCEIVIHMDDERIAGAWMQDLPRKWAVSGWKTTRGSRVKNSTQWEKILEKIEGSELKIIADPGHRYIQLLKVGCREKLASRGDHSDCTGGEEDD